MVILIGNPFALILYFDPQMGRDPWRNGPIGPPLAQTDLPEVSLRA